MPAQILTPRSPSEGWEYLKDVKEGRQIAGIYIRKLADLLLERYDRSLHDDSYPYVFRDDFAQVALDFATVIPHTQEEWSQREEFLDLTPWMVCLVMTLYGWRIKGRLTERQYKILMLLCGKKTGKSLLIAYIALFELLVAMKGQTPWILSAATTSAQAAYCWRAANRIQKRWKRYDHTKHLAKEITAKEASGREQLVLPDDSGGFITTSRNTEALYGNFPHCAILDEAALIMNYQLFTTLETSMSGRKENRLTMMITTAQPVLESPFRDRRKMAIDVLNGDVSSDDYLPFIYEVDEGDEPMKEDADGNLVNMWCWEKSMPNFGVTNSKDTITSLVKHGNQLGGVTKRNIMCDLFNVWSDGSGVDWIGRDDLEKCGWIFDEDDPTRKQQRERPADEILSKSLCVIGIDMATVRDLSSVNVLWQLPDGNIWGEYHTYLPRESYEVLDPRFQAVLDKAVDDGVLTLSNGSTTSFSLIEHDVRSIIEENRVRGIGMDPTFTTNLHDNLFEDFPELVKKVPTRATYMSPGIDEFELAVEATDGNGRFQYDGSGFLLWQLGWALIDKPKQYDGKLRILYKERKKPGRFIDALVGFVIAFRIFDLTKEDTHVPQMAPLNITL